MYPPTAPRDEQIRDSIAPLRASEAVEAGHATVETGPAELGTVEQLLVEATIQCPDADALLGDFGTLSYADLLIRAQNTAIVLRRQGVQPGNLVGVVMDQSPASIAAVAGILLAGAAYVPLERDLLEDTTALQAMRGQGLELVLHAGGAPDAWATIGSLLDVSRVEQQTMPSSADSSMPATTLNATAAVLFRRSGERVLGVEVTHRAIARLVTSQLLRFGPDETFLLLPAGTARTSLLELWGCLLHGATLALAPAGGETRDAGSRASQLAQWIARFGVGVLCVPVSLFHDLLDAEPRIFARLSQLVIEQDGHRSELSPRRLERLCAENPGLRVAHSYGEVETAGYATGYLVPNDYVAQDASPVGALIGVPLAGMQAHLLDRELFAVRDGEIGELAFSGEGVANGYWRDPEATAQRFLRRRPEAPDFGSYLFLSERRARRRADGQLELHGPGERAFADNSVRWLETPIGREEREREGRQLAMLETVRELWLRRLHRSFVGYDEDFLEAGGTAVELIRLQVELERKFPGAITMADLPALRTIRKTYQHLLDCSARVS